MAALLLAAGLQAQAQAQAGAQATSAERAPPAFSVPLSCVPGTECFLQQYPDVDPGPVARDPFCGTATYDGHKGTDLRVLSMQDVARDVPVMAMSGGKVLRLRDGEPDHLVKTDADREALAGRDCGNGIVVDHGGGWQVQYCHLKRGSIIVKPGDRVEAGEVMGDVGASGLAQFPHLHVTVRKDGENYDPATGRPLAAGCLSDPSRAEPLWNTKARRWLKAAETPILAIGIAGSTPVYDDLVEDGPPPPLAKGDRAIVGWGWFDNLRAADRIHIQLAAPNGSILSDVTSKPMPGSKAVYFHLAGRRRSPVAGRYKLRVDVVRDEAVAATRSTTVDVQP